MTGPCRWSRAEASDSKDKSTPHGTGHNESLDGVLYLNEIYISIIRKPHSRYLENLQTIGTSDVEGLAWPESLGLA